MKTPSLLDYPEFAAARTRHDALRAEQRVKDAELSKLRAELAQAQERHYAESRIDLEARARIRGDAAVDHSLQTLQEKISALAHEVMVLERAIVLSYRDLQEVRARVSRQLCAKVGPAHAKLVQSVVDTAQAHAAACTAEADFRAALQRAGVEVTLWNAQVGGLGRLDDLNSAITRFLVECCRNGLVKLEELPDAARALATPRPVPPQPVPLSVRSPRTNTQRTGQPYSGGNPRAPSSVQID